MSILPATVTDTLALLGGALAVFALVMLIRRKRRI